MYGQSARSPPPLQHPRPQHPVRQIPSASPPPPDNWNSTSEYQRFASPPVNYHPAASATQLHPSQVPYGYSQRGAAGGGATPDAYIPQHPQHAYNSNPSSSSNSSANVQWMSPDHQSSYGAPPAMPRAPGGHPSSQQPHQAQSQPEIPSNGFAGFGQSMGMGSMMNDATAQMGMQFGSHALSAGQAYLDKNFTRLLPLAHLKHSFNVSNGYVVNKLRLLLWPWRHRPWSRGVVRSETTGVAEGWKPPREDVNCPDLYIPGQSTPDDTSREDAVSRGDFYSQSWHS